MEYRQPFEGSYPITQLFGETITDPTGHKGIDYALPKDTPVLASEAGTVIKSGWDNTGYGNCVMIRHPDGNTTIYAHLNIPLVVTGQKVERSQIIGNSGMSGNSTGYHLHFEIRGADNKPFDPMNVLHSSIETPTAHLPVKKDLKGAEAFSAGELLKVQNSLGVKAFYSKHFGDYTVYPQGTPFYYTGESTVRKQNGITYMQVVPATFTVWVAVNDGDVQILNKANG